MPVCVYAYFAAAIHAYTRLLLRRAFAYARHAALYGRYLRTQRVIESLFYAMAADIENEHECHMPRRRCCYAIADVTMSLAMMPFCCRVIPLMLLFFAAAAHFHAAAIFSLAIFAFSRCFRQVSLADMPSLMPLLFFAA